jgi:hypothetical protein
MRALVIEHERTAPVGLPFGAQLERNGIDPARLLEQTRARGCAPAISGRLFDGFLDRVAAGVNA